MKEIQQSEIMTKIMNKIITVCPDCGSKIISFISDDEPIVMSDGIYGVFTICPNCGDYVPIIEMPDPEDEDIDFLIEDYKYDLEYVQEQIETIKKGLEELPYLEADANKFKFIINKYNKLKEKL
jgi:predicted RNA-binding Zn-ribbon protein involved in translation (DUF1610 family)